MGTDQKEDIVDQKWLVAGKTYDEGYKIVTEDACIGNEDYGYMRKWVATVYDRAIAEHIVELHNGNLPMRYI